jgi:hypothetical protein
MANSDFWRELAISFKSVPELYEFTAYRRYYMGQTYFSPTSITEPNWELQATPIALAEFRALAIRGATMLPPLRTSDLAVTWLEALWKDANEGPVRQGIPIVGGDRILSSDPAKIMPAGPIGFRGPIDRVFQSSSALCRKFEAEVLQIEFEERQRKQFAKKAIAHGIEPQAVMLKRVLSEFSELVRPHPPIEVIASAPPIPPIPSVETIAAQLQRLRLECNWSAEKLAEFVRLDPRTVTRHLSGETTPHLRNISAYQRIFIKQLKRHIVITKMP